MTLIGAMLLSSCLMLGSLAEGDRIRRPREIRATLNAMAKGKRL